jgi:hypothetical protein
VTDSRLEVFVAPRNEVETEFGRLVADCSAPRTEYALEATHVGSTADNEGIGDEGS